VHVHQHSTGRLQVQATDVFSRFLVSGKARCRPNRSEPALAVGEDAAHCGREHRDGVDVFHRDVGGVLLEEDHVGELAGHQASLTCVLAGDPAGALGGGPDRLPAREALVRSSRDVDE
jgi:hypothetical protein